MSPISRTLIVACSISLLALTGCSKLDPKKPLTQEDVAEALKLFDKKQVDEIQMMGGDKYLIGKTVDSVKANLSEDFANFKADEYINNSMLLRKQNLEFAAKGKLTMENVKYLEAQNDNEKKVFIHEANEHVKWLNKIKKAENAPEPKGNITPIKGTMACGDLKSAIQLADPETKEAIKTRLIRRKICRPINKELEYIIRDTKPSENQGTFYRIRAGWIPEKGIKERTSQEQLDQLKEKQKAAFQKILENPPSQFYTRLRPILDVSPQNLSLLIQAEKGIAVLADQKKVSWEEAAKDFIRMQVALQKAEVKCQFEGSCEDLQITNRQLAKLILAEKPKKALKGSLPCEILPISGCRKLLSEDELPSKKYY